MNAIEIYPGVLHIEESYRVYCSFVSGKTCSILWDTGLGRADLRSYVEKQSLLPYTVLIGYGHPDHTGGISAFEKVYLAKADWAMLGNRPSAKVFDLKTEQVYDIGDDTAQIVALPGHTPGSCGLLLHSRRLLLAGDALNPRLQLLGEEACLLETLRATLETALTLPFDRYLTSHAPTLLSKKQLEVHLKHLDHFDPDALTEIRCAGGTMWSSVCKQDGLRSEFIIGESLLQRIQNGNQS